LTRSENFKSSGHREIGARIRDGNKKQETRTSDSILLFAEKHDQGRKASRMKALLFHHFLIKR
jgi:hypothetical protein